ncbi:interleukin 19 like isoform X1 [Poecilia formosa]|uniref:interleukin 19 like isoform X1 n=2 Tax=Poecilia formosa TaxID=48698 RepID=UPI0007BA8B33|nr:PREDICTED: interleukin-20-like isoform X1 [Poecilia formosa]
MEAQRHTSSPGLILSGNTQLHLQVTTVMKMLLSSSVCAVLLLLLLGFLNGPAESRTLHMDGCSANVHLHELHQYFSEIKSDAISADGEIGVKLLDASLMKNVQEGQTCCFVRLLLRFYVERVFGNYESSQPSQQRCSSALANAFVSIRREMHKCHCHCGEETQRTIDSVLANFDKVRYAMCAFCTKCKDLFSARITTARCRRFQFQWAKK